MPRPPASRRANEPAATAVPEIEGLALTEAQRQSRALQTPFMRQWFAAKERYPRALIFFRMGDFYELFLDDAVRAAEVLGLTLTSRNKGEADEIPMAGAPHHQAPHYIAKALRAGLSVAICEQMADPAKCKGIVPREVVRVVTPGTVVDETSLEAKANAWLVAVESDAGAMAVALFDHSTGELLAADLSDGASVLAEIARVEAREVLLAPGTESIAEALALALPSAAIRREGPLDDAAVLPLLTEHIGHDEAASAAHDVSKLARRAAARVLGYAQSCTPGAAVKVNRLVSFDPGDSLQLDPSTAGHLELVRGVDGEGDTSLLGRIDRTKTAGGGRLLRRWLLAPLRDVAAIRRRHDAVELFVLDAPLRESLRAMLARVGDLERLATRAVLGQASPRDLGALRDGLAMLPAISEHLLAAREQDAREVLGLERPLDLLSELCGLLSRALVDSPPPIAREGGVIRAGYDPTVDELSELRRNGDGVLLAMEQRLREESGIPSLKLRFNKVFGWYLEVTRTHVDKVPADWRRKQTIANGERYTTDALDALADKLLSAEDRQKEREAELFTALRTEAARHGERIRAVATRLSSWDALAAFAEVAHEGDWARPHVDEGLGLSMVEGRHPVVETRLLARGARFVPNDVAVSAEQGQERLLIITGPNMAGKSTVMRTVALLTLLAQTGSFVPAKSLALGVVDRVMTRVGASDDLARGASTFMVEMRETASILRRATRRSLVILDEIGRGTSTYDGVAIAWAVAEHLHDAIGARTLFATHYHELNELAATCAGVGNFSVAAKELGDDVLFLHRLVKGAASRSYGIAVARLAGLPEPVLARARAMLSGLERGGALPSGKHATMRGRDDRGGVQLDIFGGGGEPAEPRARAPKVNPVLETLRAVDVDRLAPIEAWQLLAKLKGMTSP